MKKYAPMFDEFLKESLETNNNEYDSLDESVLSTISDFFKKGFKKIGRFFIGMYNETMALLSISPVSTAVAILENIAPQCVSYLPNKDDIKFLSEQKISISRDENELITKRGNTLKSIKLLNESYNPDILFEQYLDSLMNEMINEAKISLEHSGIRMRSANIDTEFLKKVIEVKVKNPMGSPVLIWGAPGIGKTAIINGILKSIGKDKRLIDVPLSTLMRDDFFLPAFKKDESNEIINAIDIPKSWLPVFQKTGDIEVDKAANDEANGIDGGILFLDELSRARGDVQNVALKLVEERKLGDNYYLGDKWAIIAASNRSEDDPDSVQNFSTALGNRFIQYNFVPDFKSWRKWAEHQKFISRDVLDFIEFNEKYFYTMDDEFPEIFASPRTWTKACETMGEFGATGENEGFDINKLHPNIIKTIIAGSVGSDEAEAFVAYLELKKSIKLEDLKLVYTNPEKAPLPPKIDGMYKLDAMYAIITSIVESIKRQPTSEEFKNFCTYLARLKDESFTAKGLKLMIDIYPEINKGLGEEDNKNLKEYNKYKEGISILGAAYPNFLKSYDV